MNKMFLANGEEIAYLDQGVGEEILVAIHGNMSSSKHLDVIYENLPTNIRIIAPDLRGFGQSSYNTSINSLEEYANDIIELIEKLGLKEFHLLGWSTGGGVAMELAAKLKDRVKKLVLIASVGATGYPMFKLDETGKPVLTELLKTKEELKEDTLRSVAVQSALDSQNRDFIRATWDAAIYTHNKPEESKYEEYISDVLTQKNIYDVYYSLMSFNISDEHNGVVDGNKRIYDITADTLIVQGERDYVVPMAMAESIKKGLGDKAVMVTGDFGHSPFVDCPQWINEKIFTFINK